MAPAARDTFPTAGHQHPGCVPEGKESAQRDYLPPQRPGCPRSGGRFPMQRTRQAEAGGGGRRHPPQGRVAERRAKRPLSRCARCSRRALASPPPLPAGGSGPGAAAVGGGGRLAAAAVPLPSPSTEQVRGRGRPSPAHRGWLGRGRGRFLGSVTRQLGAMAATVRSAGVRWGQEEAPSRGGGRSGTPSPGRGVKKGGLSRLRSLSPGAAGRCSGRATSALASGCGVGQHSAARVAEGWAQAKGREGSFKGRAGPCLPSLLLIIILSLVLIVIIYDL